VANGLAQHAGNQLLFGKIAQVFGPSGQHDDFRGQAPLVDAADQAEAVFQLGQAQIHQQQVRPKFFEQAPGFRSIPGYGDFVPGGFQQQLA